MDAAPHMQKGATSHRPTCRPSLRRPSPPQVQQRIGIIHSYVPTNATDWPYRGAAPGKSGRIGEDTDGDASREQHAAVVLEHNRVGVGHSMFEE